MDELGPDEQKWLDVLRAADDPNATDRARVRAAVLASIAAGGGAGVAGGASAAAGLAKSGAFAKSAGAVGIFAATWKIGVPVAAVVVAGGVTAAVLARPPASRPERAAVAVAAGTESRPLPTSVREPEPAPAAANSEAPPAVAEATPATAPGTTSEAPKRVVVPSARASVARAAEPRGGDDVEAEVPLLTQAQRALERGDPNAALVALARHGRDYPHGALAVERDGLKAIASCEGKRGDGRALAERFVASHPTSPLVARVRAACLSR